MIVYHHGYCDVTYVMNVRSVDVFHTINICSISDYRLRKNILNPEVEGWTQGLETLEKLNAVFTKKTSFVITPSLPCTPICF